MAIHPYNCKNAAATPKITAAKVLGAPKAPVAPFAGIIVGVFAPAAAVLVPLTTVPRVAAGGAYPPVGVSVADTGLGLPATKPTVGVDVEPEAGVPVVNCTCGTVMTVLRVVTVLEPTIVAPIEAPVVCTQGTVSVVDIVIVVSRIDGAAVVVEATAAAPVLVGGGPIVMVEGTFVMMPGF